MANDRITGTLMEIYKVTDPSGANTETLIALTKDDLEVSLDNTVAETTAHNETRTTQRPIIDKCSLTAMGILTTSAAALTTLGVLDGSNLLNGFAIAPLDAIRVKVYLRKGDVVPATKWLFRNVEIQIDSLSWPQEDFAEWSGAFLVNGTITKETGA